MRAADVNFPPLFPSDNEEKVVQQTDDPSLSTPIKNWIGRLQEYAQVRCQIGKFEIPRD